MNAPATFHVDELFFGTPQRLLDVLAWTFYPVRELPDGLGWLTRCPLCASGRETLHVSMPRADVCAFECVHDHDPDLISAKFRGIELLAGESLDDPVLPALPTVASLTGGRLVDGASFVLDAPEQVPALWGHGDGVAWPAGEPLLIVGPPGVGKTTLAQQLALKRCGLGEPELLGMQVAVDPRPVLYIAADRPSQAARSFRRMVGENDRAALEGLKVWKGPLPFDLAAEPARLAEWIAGFGAGTVVIDSLKDVALDLSKDETGSRVNLALQHTVAAGIEVLAAHHQRKEGTDNRKPRALADVYGSTWLTAGAGSVVLVWGQAGDPIVDVVHLKQPSGEVGPLTVIHDHARGASTLHEPLDLYALVSASHDGGLTVTEAARHLYGVTDPDRNHVEKARRKLEDLAKAGHARKVEAAPGQAVRFRPVERLGAAA